MDLLQSYQSKDSVSEDEKQRCFEESLSVGEVRSVYLVTYSQADLTKFACRGDFALAVVSGFSKGKVS